MDSSYSNITLHGPGRDRVVQALEARGRLAYVGPETDGFVVVFDEDIEIDPDLAAEIARDLSGELGGLALAVTVYEEQVFLYALARDGELVDHYNSWPGFVDERETPPEGGNAALLCAAFGAGNADAVERVLRVPARAEDYEDAESARHGDLAELLGLPAHSVDLGFSAIHEGEAEDLRPQLARVGFPAGDAAAGSTAELLRARLAGTPSGQESLARIDAMNAAAQGPAHGYFRALLAGDAAGVRALFAGEPLLDDPLSGRVDGAGLDAHVAAARALFAGGAASYVPAGTVETAARVVSHGQITGQVGGEMVMLPCACVWERADDGGLRELRAYWSPAGLKGQRGERAPIVQPDSAITLPEPIGRHLQALAADDVAGVLATYDPGCLAPVPVPWLDPEDTVRRQYGAQVGQQGAIVLSPCVVTDGGAACAVEFVTTKWDGADVPAQAGLAIYERRGERICNVHLFGDLAPAPMAGLGALGGLGGLGDLMGGMGGAGGMGGFDLAGMGGMAGLGDLGAMGGMPGLGGLNMDDVPPEVMQQAMDEAMRMLSSGNLGDMMKNLQQMMGGMGGMPGMGMPGMGGPGGGIDFGALGGLPGTGAMPDGWDDDVEDGAGGEDDDASADDSGGTSPPAGGSAPK